MNVFDRAVGIIITFWPMVFAVTLLIDPPCQWLTELLVSSAKRSVPVSEAGEQGFAQCRS